MGGANIGKIRARALARVMASLTAQKNIEEARVVITTLAMAYVGPAPEAYESPQAVLIMDADRILSNMDVERLRVLHKVMVMHTVMDLVIPTVIPTSVASRGVP